MTRFCDMPKDWMDLPRHSDGYIDGVISLQKHAEIEALKQQHQEEVTTLKTELGDVKTQQQQQAEEIHGLRSMLKMLMVRSDFRPEEVEAMLQTAQHSPVDANSGHGSTHHVQNMCTDNPLE